MDGTALILHMVARALAVLFLAVSVALRVRRIVRSGQALPMTLRVQAGVMGFAVVMLIVPIGLSVLSS